MGSSASTALVITDELRAKFPEFVELIVGSESMNDEERQYWINILPVMTPDQLESLRDILQTEKRQLADIDKKYRSHMSQAESTDLRAEAMEHYQTARTKRQKEEAANAERDDENAKKILDEIEHNP
jgi:preprotein translocase subunit SecD